MNFEQQVINNAFLLVEIEKMCKKGGMTMELMEQKCITKNRCVGIITSIKTTPYYFNKTAPTLNYLFLDIKTGKVSPMKMQGKITVPNTEKYKYTF